MQRILKRILVGTGALLLLLIVAVGALYAVTQRRIDQKLTVAGHLVSAPTDSASIERGRHLATSITKCTECHGADLGGQTFIDVPPVARLQALNLTSGKGGTAAFTDLDWERAIRHGVAPDGRKLLFMPSVEFQYLSDADFGALLAYLKSAPPVDREFPASTVGPVGRFLLAKGDLPLLNADVIQHDAPPAAAIAIGPTVEYGRYIVDIGGCRGCHGPTLSGGRIPGTPPDFPPAANITPEGIGHYTESDFFHALREGKRPSGVMIDTIHMPVRATRGMTDDETRATFTYLKTVPRKTTGGR